MLAVIDRSEMIEAQQLGQSASIDFFALVALAHGLVLSRIAYVRIQQVVQPSGPGSFFNSDLHVSAQPIDKLQSHAGFGLNNTFHHHLAGSISDRNRNAFLVHIPKG